MQSGRLTRERAFHNKRYAGSLGLGRSKYYAISDSVRERYKSQVLSSCKKRRVLEYGCGSSGLLSELYAAGAVPTGIDISEKAIEATRRQVEAAGCPITLSVMNCESLEFCGCKLRLGRWHRDSAPS